MTVFSCLLIIGLLCAPEGSRTPNPQLRRLMLYPVELQAHAIVDLGMAILDCGASESAICYLLSSITIGPLHY